MSLKKGDKVKILKGKDKGKFGKILRIFNKKNKISVEGVNLVFKNVKAKRQNEKGQKIQFPSPLASSNAALICPKCGKVTRIGNRIMENGKKTRICRKCKADI